jgi:AsmA protein
VNATITGATADPLVAGSVGLSNTTLKGFDLGSKIGALEKLAGIQSSPNTLIETLSANLREHASETAVQNLKFVSPAIGEIDGTGTISPRHDLDFKMLASINTHGVLTASLGGKNGVQVPFFVQGTSTNPVFKPDVAGIAAAEVKRLTGTKIGGVDTGQAVNQLEGLFGRKKK